MYEKLKEEIPEILKLVERVPEPFKGKCFELLLNHLLQSPVTQKPAPPSEGEGTEAAERRLPPIEKVAAIPAKVRAFLRRNSLSEDTIERLVMVEEDEVHFVCEPRNVANARGQIQWALLLALRSAILGGNFEVDPEAVRSICIEKGLYDKDNFAAIFRRERNATLFKGEVRQQGEPQGLSDVGEERLAGLIRDLTAQGS